MADLGMREPVLGRLHDSGTPLDIAGFEHLASHQVVQRRGFSITGLTQSDDLQVFRDDIAALPARGLPGGRQLSLQKIETAAPLDELFN